MSLQKRIAKRMARESGGRRKIMSFIGRIESRWERDRAARERKKRDSDFILAYARATAK